MAKFRLKALENLARQLAFTPLDTREAQLSSAEVLLHSLELGKAYPLDFVIFRITGYQPRADGNSDLLTGLALQHDLGLLIEQVSDGLKLIASQSAEPVLSIGDVIERFEVTSKTIQRWRRRGLPARRFTFADGKRRVGFFLSSVECFVAAHGDKLGSTTLCTAVENHEQAAIVHHARRLAVKCGCCVNEICLRIGKKLHRTPMAVLHTLRKHDAEHPAEAILPRAVHLLTADQVSEILVEHQHGAGIDKLAKQLGCSRSAVYRAIVEDRVSRMNRRKIRFIDDELYHTVDADAVVAEIVSQQELPAACRAEELRVPRDLPAYLRDLYRTPLLSPNRERALFLKFNFHKFQFVTARRRLEPQFAGARELNILEYHLLQITETKNSILQSNLRLVVSVARRHVRPGICLMELVSEGNLILMRAVEGFDIHKGYRFSTYVTLALMKGFAQAVPAMLKSHHGNSDVEFLSSLPDPGGRNAVDKRLDHDHVGFLLKRLDDRERLVLLAHYGIGADNCPPPVPATYEQVGRQLGLSKQRVRQIEQTALAKLREPMVRSLSS